MEVEVITSVTEVELNNKLEAYVDVNVVDGVLSQTIEADIQVNSLTFAPDNIYLINSNAEPEQWFLDIINNEIDGSPLANEVSDLDNRFNNFSDGITMQIGYLQDVDKATTYDISILKATTDRNIAGIQHLDIAKTSHDEARAISNTAIGAWQTGAGGAWFDDKISVVSNVAYSAAKSASTLTASIGSQQEQILAMTGSIEDLEKQVDGKVETWFDTHLVTKGNGDLDKTKEPYASWYNEDPNLDTRGIHTGDTYVQYELDPNGNKSYISSWRFTKTTIDEPFTDSEGYAYVRVVDSVADDAYQAALVAQDTADGKSVVYYQESFPYQSYGTSTDPLVIAEQDKLIGDILVDSDDDNKMWRYNRNPMTGGSSVTYQWQPIDDRRIEASVNRLDEATVDVNGNARAKSSLSVDANGVIGGYVAESNGNTSNFRIFADKFSITNNNNGIDAGNPFSVDTTTNKIRFNGIMEFDNLDGSTDLVKENDLRDGTTIISGNNILTGFIQADRINTATLSAISANLGTVNAGVMYNTGGTASSYSMKIDLNHGEIHIR